MRKRGVVILMAAALTASVPATALADQFAGQIALNGEAASEDVADEDSQVDMDQTACFFLFIKQSENGV